MNRLLLALLVVALSPLLGQSAEVHPLLPDDATTVAHVNVKQMINLPPAKPHAEAMLNLVLSLAPELDDALKTLGIRPLEDVEALTIGAKGLGIEDRTLIITGKFESEKIATALALLSKKQPGRITSLKVGNLTVYEDKVGQQTVWSVQVDPGTLLFSKNKDLVLATAQKDLRKPKLSETMTQLIAKQDAKTSVWAVFEKPTELVSYLIKELTNLGPGPLGLPLIVPPLPSSLNILPRLMTAGSIAVGIDKQITVQTLIRTEDKEKAEAVADLSRLLRPSYRLLLPRNRLLGRERGEALAEVLAEAKIDSDKGDVTFSFEFSSETLTKIMTPPRKP